MKFTWEIDHNDIKNVNDFFNLYRGSALVERRNERNLSKNNLDFSRDYI